MKKMIVLVFAALVLLQPRGFAWSSAGHMVIAAEAFRELSPTLKFKVAKMLESHPDYGKWAKAFAAGLPDVDVETYVFLRASTWPDEIRKGSSQYDHPKWHFIDYPLRAPDFPMEPGPAPEDDILYGIAQCQKVLNDTNSSPELKAVHLSYLIHLVGDVHQPLHCASLFNSTYPNGDRGGTEFYVKPGVKGISLHHFWDGLLGTSIYSSTQINYATKLVSENPRESLPELKKDKTPKDWSLESRALAIDKAYLHGELKGSTSAETAPPLPAGYSKTAKAVAEKQAALAGYRLADEIKKCIK